MSFILFVSSHLIHSVIHSFIYSLLINMITLLTYVNSSPLKEFTVGPSTIQCAKDFSRVISEPPCELGRKLKKGGRRVVIKRGPGCRTAAVRVSAGLLADCGLWQIAQPLWPFLWTSGDGEATHCWWREEQGHRLTDENRVVCELRNPLIQAEARLSPRRVGPGLCLFWSRIMLPPGRGSISSCSFQRQRLEVLKL